MFWTVFDDLVEERLPSVWMIDPLERVLTNENFEKEMGLGEKEVLILLQA